MAALRGLRQALDREPAFDQPDVWPTADELAPSAQRFFGVPFGGGMGFLTPPFKTGDAYRAQYQFVIGKRATYIVTVLAKNGEVTDATFRRILIVPTGSRRSNTAPGS